MAKEKNGKTVRRRTKHGHSRITVTEDAADGNLFALFQLISQLYSSVQRDLLERFDEHEFPWAVELGEALKEFLRNVKEVNESESLDSFKMLIGKIIKISRIVKEREEQIESLEATLAQAVSSQAQTITKEELSGKADQFIRSLIDHLESLQEEFEQHMEEYTDFADDFDKEQQKIEAELLELKQLMAENYIGEAIFRAEGNLIVLEQELSDIEIVTEQAKNQISEFLKAVMADHQSIFEILKKIQNIKKRIRDHNDLIDYSKDEQGNQALIEINKMKQRIKQILQLFVQLGKESYFWGLVPGLSDILKFNPVDFVHYQVHLNDNLHEDKILSYFQQFDTIRNQAEQVLSQNVENADDSDKKVEDNFQKIHKDLEENEKEQDSLAEMFIAALWSFISDRIKKAEAEGKKCPRRGDYGKLPRTVAKLLINTGYADRSEWDYIQQDLVVLLKAKGLIVIKSRKGHTTDYKSGFRKKVMRDYVLLTEKGREFASQISGKYTELMEKVRQEDFERKERFRQKYVHKE